MTIDTTQLEIDLNALLMQTQREDSEWAKQLFIRRKIRDATGELARSNAYALDVLIQNMKHLTSDYRQEPDFDAQQIAPRFAPPPLPSEQYADEIFSQINGNGRVQ